MGWVGILIWNYIIPQSTIDARFSLNVGVNKKILGKRGELSINATDLLNIMVIRKTILDFNFEYTSKDDYETRVIRLGFSYKF